MQTIGSYEIIRRLAQGGMAEVFLAKDKNKEGVERLVCLKRILPHLSMQEDFLRMFQDEARIAIQLLHPNIAQIYELKQDDQQTYLVMEYVKGEDLRQIYNQHARLHRSHLPIAIAVRIAMGVATGLHYAHHQLAPNGLPLGLVHRDISPQNILVTYDGQVKIIDFGVAKASGKLIQTQSGVLKGKYSYMSPEQARGDGIDGRSDVFALGVTLYEITTGYRLFKREQEIETLNAVIAGEIPSPREHVADYPLQLEVIVMKALAYDVNERYDNAGDFEKDLRSYLEIYHPETDDLFVSSYMHRLFRGKLAEGSLFGEDAMAGASDETVFDDIEKTDISLMDKERTLSQNKQSLLHESTRQVKREPKEDTEEKIEEDLQSLEKTEISIVSSYMKPSKFSLYLLAITSILILLSYAYHRSRIALQIEKVQPSDINSASKKLSFIRIETPITMKVQIDGHWLGDTPIDYYKITPGIHDVFLQSEVEGFCFTRKIFVATQEALQVISIPLEKGSLSLISNDPIRIQIGNRLPFECPIRLALYVGSYKLQAMCKNGSRKVYDVEILANEQVELHVTCP